MIPVSTIVPAHERNYYNKQCIHNSFPPKTKNCHWVPQAADNRHPVVEQKRICIVDNGVAPRRLGIGFRWILGQFFFGHGVKICTHKLRKVWLIAAKFDSAAHCHFYTILKKTDEGHMCSPGHARLTIWLDRLLFSETRPAMERCT